MDLNQLYTITSETIVEYDTSQRIPESNVTAIADLLLDCGEKDGRHGYVRKSEALVRHLNPDVSFDDDGSSTRPDKSVVQRYTRFVDGGLIRVERLRGERKVLIVECKSDHNLDPGSVEQIRAYMTLAEFPNGLLLSQRRAIFFLRNPDRTISQTQIFTDIAHHVEEIANDIRRM